MQFTNCYTMQRAEKNGKINITSESVHKAREASFMQEPDHFLPRLDKSLPISMDDKNVCNIKKLKGINPLQPI